jgi:dihydropteroate synthase
MAVVNLSPDSFSGDGIAGGAPAAVPVIERAVANGADVIDIGGESTRPGFRPVPAEEELARMLPTLEAVAERFPIPISVDTSKAVVAEAVLARGAALINDVSGLRDRDLAQVVAGAGAGIVLVHPGPVDPGTDLLRSISDRLSGLVEQALHAGVDEGTIVLDPGLGFGKGWRENLEIIRRLGELRELGFPLLVGPSRKGTIGKVLDLPPDQRLEGTVALVTACIAGGADVVRVHDVAPMVRVARMADALTRSG